MRSETGKNLRAHSASPILRTYAISAAFMATLFAPACAQSPTPFVDLTPTAPEAGAYKIVAGSKDVMVGPYRVASTVFTSGVCWADANCNSYRPTLWRVAKTSSGGVDPIQMQLDVQLGWTNFHTHGLVVRVDPADATKIGDNVFVTICKEPAADDCKTAGHAGAIRGPVVDYRFEFPAKVDSGLNWFHAHIHGLAQTQVSGGMSGVIAIDDVCDNLALPGGGYLVTKATFDGMCAGSPAVLDTQKVTERFLALRDMQLVNVATSATPATAGRADPIKPAFCGSDASTLPDRLGECRGVKFEDNNCGAAMPDGSCLWVFTINGQKFPTIPFGAGGDPTAAQVWRLVNQSSDVTYNLVIRKTGLGDLTPDKIDAACDPASRPGDCLPFVVLNLDGAPAVGELQPDTDNLQYRLVLMPGARAEILVRRPSLAHPATYRLEQVGLATGGDMWPAIALAKVTLAAGPQSSVGFQPTGKPASPKVARTRERLQAKSPPMECANAPTSRTTDTVRDVTVGFLVDSDGFKLATAIGAPGDILPVMAVPGGETSMQLISDGQFVSTPFRRFGFNAAGEMDMSRIDLCVETDSSGIAPPVRFHLVNFSGEIHNFHIHQQKFEILSVVAPDSQDQLLAGYFAGPGQRARHDTVPVPRAAIVDGAMAFGQADISMAFDLEEKKGKYVYHCHILEHEDGGMMAAIMAY
jgi:FtsP/CotA-like multicopper oxidase with cupredoxin domain